MCTATAPFSRSEAGANRIFYLTAPHDVREFGTWCVTVGAARTQPGDQYPPDELRHPHRYRAVSGTGRVLDELQLVFIAQGRGVFEDSVSGTQRIEAGTCLVLMPRRWHRYHPDPSAGWSEYWVGVRGDAAFRAVRLLGLDLRGPVLKPGNHVDIASTYEHLLELAAVHDIVAHIGMTAGVLDLMTLMARGRGGEPGQQGRADSVAQAIRIMQSHVHDRVRLSTIARECGLGETTLRRAFRSQTGSSPYRYYMALKVNAAKMELAHSAQPLKAIAARLGFTDQYHLSRVFKEYTGVSPTRWRQHGG